jgi:ankyrin repeat protein
MLPLSPRTGPALKGDLTLMHCEHRLTLSLCLPLLAAAAVHAAPAPPPPSRLGQDLYMAIGQRNMAAVKALLSQGADPDARNFLMMRPMIVAAGSGQVEAIQLLLDAGAKLDGETPYGTALTFAEMGPNPAATQFLLEKGADVNAKRMDGITVLMLAARNGHTEIARELLARKADLNARDNAGTTALTYAARDGRTETARFLIDQGAPVDAVDSHGWTALMAAAANGQAECARMLIERGAKVNAREKQGRTALMIAAAYGDHPEVIQALLDGGADRKLADAHGRTALSLATARGRSATASLLGGPSAGAAPETANIKGKTARMAISASLAALQRSNTLFLKQTGCASCHHQGLGMMVTGLARDRGFATDTALTKAQLERVNGAFADQRPLLLKAAQSPPEIKNVPLAEIGDVPPAFGYLLTALHSQHQPRNETTGAAAMVLARLQMPDGHWQFGFPRVPIQSSYITMTALAVRSIQAYAPKAQAAEIAQRVGQAKAWLLAAPVTNTEDKALRLLGLKWAGASAAERQKAAAELIADQRPDGGWTELPSLQSDAYATGQALYALNQGGDLPASDAVYRRGTQFLLRTQEEDGSWFVNKRAIPANNYFDAGFPHGQSQYVSHGATCWATMALLLTVDKHAAVEQTAER